MSKIIKKKKEKNSTVNEAEINKLAHEGTEEAIAKIKAYINVEKDFDRRGFAEVALRECEFLCYQPKNEDEERDFELCRLIYKHKRHIDSLEVDADKIRESLVRFKLEQDVHGQVMVKNKNIKNDWQYRYMDDFMMSDKHQLTDVMDNIAYEEAWVEAAKNMIVSPRYKSGMLERQLVRLESNEPLFADDGGCDCCCDDCQDDYDRSDIDDLPF